MLKKIYDAFITSAAMTWHKYELTIVIIDFRQQNYAFWLRNKLQACEIPSITKHDNGVSSIVTSASGGRLSIVFFRWNFRWNSSWMRTHKEQWTKGDPFYRSTNFFKLEFLSSVFCLRFIFLTIKPIQSI